MYKDDGGQSARNFYHKLASKQAAPKRTNAHPERDLQNAVIQWLTMKQICFVRINANPSTIVRNGQLVRIPSPMAGWPDILCIVGQGLAVGLEIKVDWKQTDNQKEVQARIEKANGKYFIIKSLEQVIGIFTENGWTK